MSDPVEIMTVSGDVLLVRPRQGVWVDDTWLGVGTVRDSGMIHYAIVDFPPGEDGEQQTSQNPDQHAGNLVRTPPKRTQKIGARLQSALRIPLAFPGGVGQHAAIRIQTIRL